MNDVHLADIWLSLPHFFMHNTTVFAILIQFHSISSARRGVHELRMGKGSAARFSESYTLLITKCAVIPIFMMNFDGKLPIFDYFFPISGRPTHVYGKSAEKGPLLGNLGPKNPLAAHTHTLIMLCTPPRFCGFGWCAAPVLRT